MRLNFHLAHGESARQGLLKLLACCFYASDALQLGVVGSKGAEADLFVDRLTGERGLSIFLGPPSLADLNRASRQSERVVVLGITDAAWLGWWQRHQHKLARLPKLSVVSVSETEIDTLLPSLQNRVRWHGVLDHETLWLHHNDRVTEVVPNHLQTADTSRIQAA